MVFYVIAQAFACLVCSFFYSLRIRVLLFGEVVKRGTRYLNISSRLQLKMLFFYLTKLFQQWWKKNYGWGKKSCTIKRQKTVKNLYSWVNKTNIVANISPLRLQESHPKLLTKKPIYVIFFSSISSQTKPSNWFFSLSLFCGRLLFFLFFFRLPCRPKTDFNYW